MEQVLTLIRENSAWIFGGSSLCAVILLALGKFRQPEPAKSGKIKKTSDRETSGTSNNVLIYALVAVAAVSGGISIFSTNAPNTSGSANSIVSGNNSTNFVAKDSSVNIETNKQAK